MCFFFVQALWAPSGTNHKAKLAISLSGWIGRFSAPSCSTHDFCLEGSLAFSHGVFGGKRFVISEKLRYLLFLILS